MLALEVSVRMFVRCIAYAALAFLAALIVLLAAPKLIGGEGLAVLSNSMKGAVDTGDQVIVFPHRASEIKVGEIVAFNHPDSGALTQHRVQRVDRREDQVRVVTKGDMNNTTEQWQVAAKAEVGRVALVIPKAGYLSGSLSNRNLRVALIAIPAFLLMVFALVSIWREPVPRELTHG